MVLPLLIAGGIGLLGGFLGGSSSGDKKLFDKLSGDDTTSSFTDQRSYQVDNSKKSQKTVTQNFTDARNISIVSNSPYASQSLSATTRTSATGSPSMTTPTQFGAVNPSNATVGRGGATESASGNSWLMPLLFAGGGIGAYFLLKGDKK